MKETDARCVVIEWGLRFILMTVPPFGNGSCYRNQSHSHVPLPLQPLPSEFPSWISRGDVSLLSASFSTVHPPSFSLSSGNPVDPVTRFYLLVIPRRAITRWVTAGKLHLCESYLTSDQFLQIFLSPLALNGCMFGCSHCMAASILQYCYPLVP